MARFERSREGKGRRDSNDGSSRSRGSFGDGSRDKGGFDDRPRGRGSYDDRRRGRGSFGEGSRGRESGGYDRNRRDVQLTKVTCSSCGADCEVPFKPTSSKPVYCDDCFAKKGRSNFKDKGSFEKPTNQDFDLINEKLNKIMKALKIE